jgi:hypothetical protein
MANPILTMNGKIYKRTSEAKSKIGGDWFILFKGAWLKVRNWEIKSNLNYKIKDDHRRLKPDQADHS